MKKEKIIPLLLSWMMATAALADNEGYTMNINLKDGSMVQFVLASQKPEVMCKDGMMTIYYDYDSASYQYQNVSFERDLVKDLPFSTSTGIKPLTGTEGKVRFILTRSGELRVTGLKDDDHLSVYTMDGKMIPASVSRSGSEAVVDLEGRAHGVYVVSVHKCFTVKLMTP